MALGTLQAAAVVTLMVVTATPPSREWEKTGHARELEVGDVFDGAASAQRSVAIKRPI